MSQIAHNNFNNILVYEYCWKCGKIFEAPSPIPFCDEFCRREYFLEIRQDNDDTFREWAGAD